MDGYVTIGTSLDSKGLEKDLRDAERQLRQYEKEAEKLTKQKVKIEADVSDFEAAKTLIQQQTDETLKNAQTQEQVNFVLGVEEENLKGINAAYEISKDELNEINQKIKENVSNQENARAKINEINDNLNRTKKYNNLKDMFKDMGESAKNTAKKIAGWALAIIGVRTAYNSIRNALSIITQQDEQLAADIEYMKNALAYALEPIVRVIVNLMKQLMFYVGYIVKAWTGKNIFENANKNLKGANKQAKQLSKTLAGFDEKNVLSDTSGGSGDVGALPSFDLTNLEDMPIPSWLQWIADNKDLVIAGLLGIAGGLIAVHFGASLIMSLGIGAIVAGIVMLIQDIIKFIKDPSWENFVNILGDIAIIIGGIMLVMGNWWGLLVVIVGLAVKLIADNWDTISGILGKIGGWIWNYVLQPVWNFIKAIGETIWSYIKFKISSVQAIFTTLINILSTPFRILWDTVKEVFGGIKTTIEGIFNVIKGIFIGDFKTVMSGFKQIFKGAFDSLWGIAKAPLNLIIEGINSLIKGANKIKFDVPDWVPGLGGKKFGFNIKTIPKLAKGGIINMPGRGVPIGSAIGGERGQEGVIPLTDSQQMAMLGEAIGRYINVNATIPVYVGNRQIARELRKINAEDDFAFNG